MRMAKEAGMMAIPLMAPITLQIQDAPVLLSATDSTTLLEAIESWRTSLEHRLSELRSSQPHSVDSAVQTLSDVSSFASTLAAAPGGLADPPVEVGPVQARLLRQVLSDWVGYQGRELTIGLKSSTISRSIALAECSPRLRLDSHGRFHTFSLQEPRHLRGILRAASSRI